MSFTFQVDRRDEGSSARAGRLMTPHGEVKTPVFMPVGTQATVKTLSPWEIRETGAEIILGNSYHLYLRPGTDIVREAGGLSRFSGWGRATLTDSGGFQLFSLADLARVTEDGVTFHSHLDGSLHFFSPEKVVEIGFDLGPDIMMVLDECTSYPASHQEAADSARLTCFWAARANSHWQELLTKMPEEKRETSPYPMAVVQGSTYEDLRRNCTERLMEIDFPGYAIGGMAVGEPESARREMVELTAGLLPADRPRYLMGVGYPEDMIDAIASGVDMFDCVLPTRNARTGTLFTRRGRLVVKNAVYARDFRPPDEECSCPTCRNFTRSYLRHLFNAGEMLGPRLATIHNVHFFVGFVAEVREAIKEGRLGEFRRRFQSEYPGSRTEIPGNPALAE